MDGSVFPTTPGALTTEWLTEALRFSGATQTSSVTSFEKTIIGEGTGFMGQLAQVRLRYDRPEPGAPQSLIAKFPAPTRENRDVAMYFRLYERETGFYAHIAHQIELRTPRCYFNAFVPKNGDFLLLLEDLAPARVGDQVTGCSVEHARMAIHELAKFQATWWNSPKLDALEWIPAIDAEWNVAAAEENYEACWVPFVEFAGEMLTPAVRSVGERLRREVGELMRRMSSELPRTIVHGDYRLDNMFFATPEGGPKFAVIDWQISTRSGGVFDVAYFVAGTLPPEERRAHERGIVRSYHDTLVDHGVRGYSFEQCWEDYRRSALFLLGYSVIGAGGLDLSNERGVEVWKKIVRGTLEAIDDLKAYETLD